MNMKKIAIICGGDSSEHDVSLKSGAGIYSFFNKDKYDCYIVDLKKGDWHVNLADGKQAPIDKNDFSFMENGEKKHFDYAYITIHGTPGGLLRPHRYALLHQRCFGRGSDIR